MNLLHQIKSKRAKKDQKQPLKRDVFNHISSIVREYGLDMNFLKVIENVENNLSKTDLKANRVRVKTSVEHPLFSLTSQDEYVLTTSIIRKIDNSYLKFACSPNELLWCGPLYRLNPSLKPEKLARYHFETLFLHERAKTNNQDQDLT